MRGTCVRIDLEKVRRRLSRLHGREYTAGETHAALRSEGFHLSGLGWYCDGAELGTLQPDEIIEIVRQEQENGVTFISREPPPRPSAQSDC